MSEQALDLRRSLQIVRRHRILVGAVAALGLLGGAAFTFVNPPTVVSRALVVLPTPTKDTATQVVIAGSDPVLIQALPYIHPAVSLATLRNEIQVRSLTTTIIAISARGHTAVQAEAAANAVASRYLVYTSSAGSPVSATTPASPSSPAKHASLLERASSATGTPLPVLLAITAAFGAALGLLLGALAALAISRGDRRLRERDEIADAIGIPVIAAVPVGHPSDAAGWAKLLADYDPGPVYAWRLRRAMHHLGISDSSPGPGELGDDRGATLAMLSLSSDPGALALGPQLAVFAASLGIRTALVIGPQQDPGATATLRAACTVASAASLAGSRSLQVMVRDHARPRERLDAALTIVVITVDNKTPQLAETLPTSTTVLGVSAGMATAEDLARVAVCAATSGRQIAGILVADPERTDHTSGRMMAPARHASRRQAAHPAGMPTEASR